MNLENLVPPLELCKMIPSGHFEDSALVWSRRTSKFAPHECVFPRGYAAEVSDIAPAPTLQEIMDEAESTFGIELEFGRFYINTLADTYSGKNAAEIALKYWLKQEGIK